MKIVLCDDHVLFLEALSVVLTDRGHEVVAQCSSPEEAVRAARVLQPDVCVMDLHFPNGDARQALHDIQNVSPRARVLVLSGDPDARVATSTVLMKYQSIDRIIGAIEGRPSAPKSSNLRTTRRSAPAATPEATLGSFLTPRERQVLELLVAGTTTVAIAKQMTVTYGTARTHIQNIVTKLGVHSKVAAAAFAVKNGLVDVNSLFDKEHSADQRGPVLSG
jgi:two-component system nitrate/nitrite response regulator NarL